ncbi:hypothetical protein LWI29_027540 [Acer saccharum]|uniref:Retrotransposon gag domain-containing protein n=1 Tax=Acer saccharum TaxID=4024 RepID=A0AA39W8V3_ACESA|nr:hypothetical protein LWI29_027540 [Acer saccharum]
MDQRLEQLENAMGEVVKLTEAFNKLTDRVEQIAIQTSELAGNSASRVHTPGRAEDSTDAISTLAVRRNAYTSQLSGSYVPKTIKIDFPRYEGKDDPTIWLCKAEQFFQLHAIPTIDRVQLASFHLEGDAHLWYQLLQQEMPVVSWEDFKDGLNSRYGPNQYLDFFEILHNSFTKDLSSSSFRSGNGFFNHSNLQYCTIKGCLG